MIAKVFSFGLLGIEAYPIEIEVDVSRGLPAVTLVGLADTAIKESKERIKSAIKNSGFDWPGERVTISLTPSNIRKEGASFDLAIALGILTATGQLNSQNLKDYYILGELSLDGSLRPIPGILPIGLATAKSNIKNLIVPLENAKEAGIISDICVWPLKTLRETVEFFNNAQTVQPFKMNLEDEAKELLKLAMTELGLSARAYDKVLKAARAIADLVGSENIQAEHISEAVQYRSLDRQ